jgi:hypothetical protein
MATKLYIRFLASDYGTGHNDARLSGAASAWDNQALSTTIGTGAIDATSSTVLGPTSGIEVGDTTGVGPNVWYSPPLNADITISGSVTWNIWARESDMAANVAINGQLEVIDGATGAITLIDKTARVTELAISATTNAVNNFSETPASGVACKRGDRLRVRIFGDDVGTMGAAFNFSMGYDGTTSSVNGDTWLQLTENLTFVSEPAGTTIYPTDTTATLGGASASLLSSFTGSDEDPLSEGGNWAKLSSASAGALKRISNTVARNATGTGSAYWTPATFGPDVEAYCTLTTVSSARVFARLQDAGGSGTADGYSVAYLHGSTQIIIYRTTNFADTALSTSTIGALTDGAKIGIACHGSTVQAWVQTSGGSWSLLASATDTTYASAGHVGLLIQDTATRVDDFYAGTATETFPVTEREAWTSRGAGVQTDVTNTVAGWTTPLQVTDTAGGTVVDWFTRPLAAFTLGGAVRVNARALESNALANVGIRCEIARVAGDGSSPTVWGATTMPTELGTTEAARSFLVGGDDLAISDGQRLRIRFSIDDQEAAMGASQTVTLFYAGTSGGASGDTYLTFTQTLTEFTAGTSANAITATATGAVNVGADAIVATPAVATTTGVANNPTAVTGISTTAGVAAGTGAAQDADASVAPTAQVAAATGAALNATVSTAVSVTAGVAAATGTSGPAAVGTSPYSTLIQQDQPNGYWRLGEASGNPQDTSGHGNHVTTTGGTPTYSVTGSLAADPNTAITLDGSTEYFSVPQDASLHGNTISIELWFKRAPGGGGTQFLWDNGFGDSELYFSSDTIFFGRAGVATLRQSAGTYTDTDWHHLVAVKDGSTSREIYVDGVAVGTGGTDSTLANANGVSGIGAQQAWNNHWNGSLDEVAVYAYALTAGQVLAHYTAGAPAAATEANAEVATATGAAANVTPAVAGSVAAATATGAAADADMFPSQVFTANAATATGTALDATVTTAAVVSANAITATATGAAAAAAPSIAPDLDAATATGTAITATTHELQPVVANVATASGAAQDTDAKVGATTQLAAATAAASNTTAKVTVNAGTAAGTGAALVADGLPGTRALANVATATAAALVADGLPGEIAAAVTATGTTAALGTDAAVAPTTQPASATGVANGATVSTASTGQVTGQTALATGAALGTTAKVTANLAVAAASGAAANPAVSTSLARTPDVAVSTGAALDTDAKVTVNAVPAAATGMAANATVTTAAAVSATAQVATAQGAAHAATVGAASNVSATPSAATATGAAHDARIVVAVAAAAATGTGNAAAASIAVAVAAYAQTATATGTAYDAGVALGAAAALAQVAVASGTAYNARAQTAIGSGIDTAGGIHGGIVSLPAIRAGLVTVPGVRGGVASEPGPRGGIVTEPRIRGRVA